MCRHKVWSIGCSPRNTLQFLWELSVEVTCCLGRCFNNQEAQQIKVQDQQLAAKMVPCRFISTWSTGKRVKAVPPLQEMERRCKGKVCEEIVQRVAAGSAAVEVNLTSFKSRDRRSRVTPAIYTGSRLQRTHKIKAVVCGCPKRTTRS